MKSDEEDKTSIQLTGTTGKNGAKIPIDLD